MPPARRGATLTRTESQGALATGGLRLSLHKLPFQSGLFFFFLYTGRQRGEISLSYYFYFSNLPRCVTRPAAGLPRAGARLSAVGALCPREPGSGGLQRGRLQGSCSGSFPALVLPPRPYPGRSRGRGGTLERIQPRAGAGSPGKGCVRATMERAPRALDDWKPSHGLAPLPDAAGLRQPAFKPAPKIKCQCLFCRRGKLCTPPRAPRAASLARKRRVNFCPNLCK